VIALARNRTYSANSIVFFEGDDSNRVFIVRSGLVKLHLTIDGREILLDVLGPGDVSASSRHSTHGLAVPPR